MSQQISIATLLTIFASFSAQCLAGTFVSYDGSDIPQNNTPAFAYEASAVGHYSVSEGSLTIDTTSPAGSQDFTRYDHLTGSDLAIIQFRARTTRIGSTPGIISGGVVQLRWADPTSGFAILFLRGDQIMLRSSRGSFLNSRQFNRLITIDTSQFHTYTIVKNRQSDVQLWIDGVKRIQAPYGEFEYQTNAPATQSFQGNPVSTTQYDFFRYAIGDDAFEHIPVPEPSAYALVVIACVVIGHRRRH